MIPKLYRDYGAQSVGLKDQISCSNWFGVKRVCCMGLSEKKSTAGCEQDLTHCCLDSLFLLEIKLFAFKYGINGLPLMLNRKAIIIS